MTGNKISREAEKLKTRRIGAGGANQGTRQRPSTDAEERNGAYDRKMPKAKKQTKPTRHKSL